MGDRFRPEYAPSPGGRQAIGITLLPFTHKDTPTLGLSMTAELRAGQGPPRNWPPKYTPDCWFVTSVGCCLLERLQMKQIFYFSYNISNIINVAECPSSFFMNIGGKSA